MGSSEFATSVAEVKPVVSGVASALTAVATILGVLGMLASFS